MPRGTRGSAFNKGFDPTGMYDYKPGDFNYSAMLDFVRNLPFHHLKIVCYLFADNTQSSNGGMEDFLQSQALQNQKFMHEMALIQNRAESRTPGAQYGARSLSPDDYETNKEVLGVARSIYGTGFRA
jgi:hypothetical protein